MLTSNVSRTSPAFNPQVLANERVSFVVTACYFSKTQIEWSNGLVELVSDMRLANLQVRYDWSTNFKG